jgi:hypothetical protein
MRIGALGVGKGVEPSWEHAVGGCEANGGDAEGGRGASRLARPAAGRCFCRSCAFDVRGLACTSCRIVTARSVCSLFGRPYDRGEFRRRERD